MLGLLAGGCVEEPETVESSAPPATRQIAAPPSPAQQVSTPPPAVVLTAPITEIGRSVEGRPIQMHRFGVGARPVLIIGGIHGSEGNSSVCADLVVQYLRAHPIGVPVAVIPAANPDGLATGRRTNAHQVDLNRNFPSKNWVHSPKWPYFGGHQPGGEPETAALMAAIERLQPRRIVSIHSIEGDPCNNYDGPAEALARAMASHNGYAVKASIGYPTPGSLGSWAGIDRQIPTITLELRRATSGEAGWAQNREAILGFIRFGG
jgi:protein MpaA